jgi:hypothetical protein
MINPGFVWFTIAPSKPHIIKLSGELEITGKMRGQGK